VNDNVIFVDTETTSLDHERGEVWEVGLIENDGTEHEWRLFPQNLRAADEGALRITRFYERIEAAGFTEEFVEEGYPKRPRTVRRANFWTRESRDMIAGTIAALTANKHLVGAVPWFDARFLAGFMGREGYVPAWHYHMVDVETFAAGYLRGRQKRAGRGSTDAVQPPWSLAKIAEALNLDITDPQFEKHTAIGDARLARAIYLKVMGDAVGLPEEGGQ
jgi:hypothetical protein